ncbi:hypothetical protein C8R45DRAFT_927375 [Mycena sanguinolenta]|nr:hypothetical protein C8R45DRAFT_927375 [Mycena sanguinolenta]
MQLLAFVSIAFFVFQLGVTANPIPDPLPVPEVATPACVDPRFNDRRNGEGLSFRMLDRLEESWVIIFIVNGMLNSVLSTCVNCHCRLSERRTTLQRGQERPLQYYFDMDSTHSWDVSEYLGVLFQSDRV